MYICDEAKEEYRFFLVSYLFPLLGIKHKAENLEPFCGGTAFFGEPIYQYGDDVYFSTNKEVVFRLPSMILNPDDIKVAKNILPCFFNVSKYVLDVPEKRYKFEYPTELQKEQNYKMAVQRGIANWIVGFKSENVEKLFDILEKWSVQTYEGKKVTFGFIINPDRHSSFDDEYGNWCDFLKDDFSAVLTDCINSVIELDKECDFVRYISLTDANSMEESVQCKLDTSLPFRFFEIIKKYVVHNAVGVFLLNNGDIILSKDGSVRFVKRNLKWLNFNIRAFKNSLSDFSKNKNISDELLMNIYASVLDVSFAHTGGIISIVTDVNEITDRGTEEYPILNTCDNLLASKSLDDIAEEIRSSENKKQLTDKEKNALEEEIKKRLLKRKVILHLIENKNFVDLDRKLRCELISMDGACILNSDGDVCSFGAIIKNDSGSSGGGRGAAAKKLSKYGMAIKISTDGYIEVFVNGDVTYSIK